MRRVPPVVVGRDRLVGAGLRHLDVLERQDLLANPGEARRQVASRVADDDHAGETAEDLIVGQAVQMGVIPERALVVAARDPEADVRLALAQADEHVVAVIRDAAHLAVARGDMKSVKVEVRPVSRPARV
jgi:hypothetical protein